MDTKRGRRLEETAASLVSAAVAVAADSAGPWVGTREAAEEALATAGVQWVMVGGVAREEI